MEPQMKKEGMPSKATAWAEPPICDGTRPADSRYLELWRRLTGWAGSAMGDLVVYLTGFKRYNESTQNRATDSTESNYKMLETKTAEKLYRINDNGRVLKRSLRQDEYHILSNGKPFIPVLVVERLKNEAACMAFIKENTDIPVPKLLDAYEENGSYHLWMEFVDGVEMSELTEEEQSKVFPQIQNIITTLQGLRSKFTGGPEGHLCPPSVIYFYHFSDWHQQFSVNNDYVFCHSDLSQNNILVNPKTLQIVAIIDWEYGGYFPQEHEIPFYESSEPSGKQVKDDKFAATVDKMIEFWRQSQRSLD